LAHASLADLPLSLVVHLTFPLQEYAMVRPCVRIFIPVAAMFAWMGFTLRPEKVRGHHRMVEGEVSSVACGLALFGALDVGATFGDAKAAFAAECEATYPRVICTSAVSELWEGQDLAAEIASASPEMCARLRSVVDIARRSVLEGQSADFTMTDLAAARKIRSERVAQGGEDVVADDSEQGEGGDADQDTGLSGRRGPRGKPPPPSRSTPAPNPDFPAGLLACEKGTPPARTSCSSPTKLKDLDTRIRTAIVNHHDSLPVTCNSESCPRGDLAGCLVRLTGHDIMDFDRNSNTGGADGCIDFQDQDNKGLEGCMLKVMAERDLSNVSLEFMWQDFCTEVSIADFFVIAAEALMAATAPSQHRQLWAEAFATNFRFGRRTALECNPGRLPDASHSCDAVEETFMNRMGLSAIEATALMGVHTLGRASPENSGYDGFWVADSGAKNFGPEYYRNLIAASWKPAMSSGGKMQWIRADVPDSGEMMLNTDMCLAYQTGRTPPWTRAEDETHTDCCLWTTQRAIDSMQDVTCQCHGEFEFGVGGFFVRCSMDNCCPGLTECEGNRTSTELFRSDAWQHANATLKAVERYAGHPLGSGLRAWHSDFIRVWKLVTEQGQTVCSTVRGAL